MDLIARVGWREGRGGADRDGAGGGERRVRIERTDGAYLVTLHAAAAVAGSNGLPDAEGATRVYRIDAASPGISGVLSLLVAGAQHEVAVRPHAGGSWWVGTRDGSAVVELADPLTHLAAQSRAGKTAKRRQRVSAYMPGRVVAVLVGEGQPVTAGQGVVVLEAMKMQNEILAEHDGVVTRILVEAGQSVEGGSALFEIE